MLASAHRARYSSVRVSTVWYFAYGSNMQIATFRGRRGIAYRRAVPARLAGWRLVLDKPPLVPVGHAFANVVPDPAGAVVGVLSSSTNGAAPIAVDARVRFAPIRSFGRCADPVGIETVNVVVSDLSMPGEDGYSLLRRIKTAARSVPAIALTGFTRAEDKARVLKAGFAAYVAKPIDPDELARVVAMVVGERR